MCVCVRVYLSQCISKYISVSLQFFFIIFKITVFLVKSFLLQFQFSHQMLQDHQSVHQTLLTDRKKDRGVLHLKLN